MTGQDPYFRTTGQLLTFLRHNLTENDARELIARLVDHYIFLANGGERLVIRKLASTLATIFLKTGAPWTRAILSIGASLANSKYVDEEACISVNLESILPSLSGGQIVALLYFSNILAEDICRLGMECRHLQDTRRISENLPDSFLLVEFVLSQIVQHGVSGGSAANEIPGTEAINSFHVSFATCHLHYWMRRLTSTSTVSLGSLSGVHFNFTMPSP